MEVYPVTQKRATANIPAELRTYRAWVVWRYLEREGKRTKMLYDPLTGRSASTRDSRTWRSFEEAAATLKVGRYEGLGFVFSTGDPYTGVDLDGCRDPESGEPAEWAVRIVEGLGGYNEARPSGCGVHVIVRGDLPEGVGSKVSGGAGGKIEAYSAKRFFTMTGRAL